ncbi:MAG: 50S ribosomal protein L23 [Candidatus Magasanikbacteria bacterium]|nr:50S ribosomal protein L23 [Candidatus Magasanikbacteria bacterium]
MVGEKNTNKTESAKGGNKNAHTVLIRSLVSEKSTIQESMGQYTFVVAKNANKVAIKNAIHQVYGVMPKRVRVMNYEGKRMRFGKNKGKRSDWKKAVAYLPKGKSINIHEGV